MDTSGETLPTQNVTPDTDETISAASEQVAYTSQQLPTTTNGKIQAVPILKCKN